MSTPDKDKPVELTKAEKAEKKKEEELKKKEAFQYILRYPKIEWKWLSWGMVCLVIGTFGETAMPFIIGMVIDDFEKQQMEAVKFKLQIALVVVLVAGIFAGFRAAIFNITSDRIARNVRVDYFKSCMEKDMSFFDTRRTGELLSRLNSDVMVVQDGLSSNVSMVARGVVVVLEAFVAMAITQWQLFLVAIVAMSPIVLLTTCFNFRMRNLMNKIQTEKGKMTQVCEEAFGNIRTVKSFANEKEEIHKFEAGSKLVQAAEFKKMLYQAAFTFCQQVFLYMSMVIVVKVGITMYQDKKTTIGAISQFLFFMLLVLWNAQIIAWSFNNLFSMFGASDRIVEVIKEKPLINISGGKVLEGEQPGNIVLKNVKFTYPTNKNVQVLKGVDIEVNNETKRVVALCGTSGCGKSSVIKLVERFYDPEEGEVLFNGINLKDIDPVYYHTQISIVQQEPVLFSGTIQDNVLYGLDLKDKSEEEKIAMMDEATRSANAYNFIHDPDHFPLSYQTVVGERGVKLSGGQKQRIAIARALIRKPKLLILDEATSALDAESEHQVQQALDELIKTGKQTILVVAHRLSTIRDADEIIVMQYGEVKERGNHDALIAMNGVYKNLVARQLVEQQVNENC